MSYYFGWRPYISVAKKRRQAEREVAKLKKRKHSIAPVKIDGRTIARSFWGQAWCTNLERYSDYENRLPRGRTYVRNGCVVDLQIARGEVTALVAGSDLYRITIAISPVKISCWKAICRDCAGTIDSLIELLQGRLAKGVMDRVCREGDGLFPSPGEIKLSCSCPDWADMCKHVAAALYGIGARLDEKPQLLFVLRGVDENELIANAGDLPLSKATPYAAKVLDHGDVGALFGLEMAETAHFDYSAAPQRSKRTKVTKAGKAQAKLKPMAANEPNYKTRVAHQNSPSRTSPARREPKRASLVQARKRRSQRRRDREASANQ